MNLKRKIISSQSSISSSRSVKSKPDSSCVTTTVVDNFDDYLLTKILLQLPAKTVAGLKVINKRWYSLISDPFFVNKHTSLQTNRDVCSYFSYYSPGSRIICLSSDRSSPGGLLCKTSISLGLPKEYERTPGYITACCHGLLLIQFGNYICIFNPLTKKKQLIMSLVYKRLGCCYGLAFGPTSSCPYYYNNYNVVCMIIGYTMIRFKIFNPKEGCWKDFKKTAWISYGNGLDSVDICFAPVCLQGIIYWFTRRGLIIAFNLDKGESRVFEIPEGVSNMVPSDSVFTGWWSCTWVGVVDDELNVVVVTPNLEMVIWVLYDYEKNLWKIKRDDVIETKTNNIAYIRPMFFDGERLVLNVTIGCTNTPRTDNWQEYHIGTGVSGPLFSDPPIPIYPNISTLTEV